MTGVLMIHGSTSRGRMWRGLQKHLTDRPNSAPDLLGAGDHPALQRGEAGGMRSDLEALSLLLEALPSPVDVVGHSYGGLLALHLGLMHPDRVRQVIAHEPICWSVLFDFGSDEDQKTLTDRLDLSKFLSDERGGSEAWIRALFDFWNGDGAWSALPERPRGHIMARSWKTFLEVRDAFLDKKISAALDRYPIPVRLTVGAKSPTPARRVIELMSPILPDVEVETTSGGHLAPLTHPDEVERLFSGWLADG